MLLNILQGTGQSLTTKNDLDFYVSSIMVGKWCSGSFSYPTISSQVPDWYSLDQLVSHSHLQINHHGPSIKNTKRPGLDHGFTGLSLHVTTTQATINTTVDSLPQFKLMPDIRGREKRCWEGKKTTCSKDPLQEEVVRTRVKWVGFKSYWGLEAPDQTKKASGHTRKEGRKVLWYSGYMLEHISHWTCSEEFSPSLIAISWKRKGMQGLTPCKLAQKLV